MYKFKITIDKTKVTGTNTNFVYLFSELCSSIPAGFWTHVTDTATGLDIRFFDTDGITELKREIVSYSAGTSKVEAWVQIPSLGTSVNKEIWCQYGGPTVVNSTAVWTDAGATSVYHGQNSFNDSTGSANGVVSGMTQVDGGKIYKGYNSTGGSNKITITKQMHSGVYTICAWVYMTGNNSSDRVIVSDFIGGDTSYALILRNNTSFYGPNQSNGTIGWAIYQYQGTLGWAGAISGDTYNSQINAWHRVVGIYNGSHIFKIYVDGILKNTYDITPYNLTTANSTNTIGTLSGYGLSLIGTVDELNYYTNAKSGDWIATEYANQNDPATFSTASAETEIITTYKFKITINKTKVTGTNTNFVYLFSELCSSIPSGFWAHVKDSNGLDIRFFDTDGITELKREVVSYSAGTSKVEAWVQIPSLGTSVNKEIWCQYGGPTVANSTSVWTDVSYKAVYHLQANGNDSTGVNNASVQGAPSNVTGKIEKAYSFDGSADYFDAGNDSSVQLSTTGSLSAWVKTTDSGHSIIFGKDDFVSDRNGYTFDIQSGKLLLELANNSTYDLKYGVRTNIADNTWHYVVAVWNGSQTQLYADGVPDGTSSSQSVVPTSSLYSLWLGNGHTRSDFYFNGTLDDLRVASGVLSSDWIATEYANQNDPATFSSCGAESSVQTSKESIIIMWMSGV
jgi:hypothetical protein